MGLFGFLNYSKAGPGVDKNAPKKKRFFYFWELYFRKFWKIVALNLLFLLFCLPIVTIGPAIAGMTYVLRQFALEKPVFLFADFWEAFKSNWKQSVVFSVLQGIVFSILGVSLYYYYTIAIGKTWIYYIPFAITIFVTVIMLSMSYYVYLMAITVDLPLRHILKNSFIFAFLGAKTNLITIVWTVLITAAMYLLFPLTIPLLVLLTFSTHCFITVYNSYPYLERYIIEPQREDEDDDDDDDEDDEDDDEDDDEPIFTDIGSSERAPEAPVKGSGKIIR